MKKKKIDNEKNVNIKLESEEDITPIPMKVITKMYWTKDTDDAIFEFIAETDDEIRSKIFEKRIHKPLVKLIDFMTFKLNIIKHKSPEQDIHALRASCFEKFFRITTPNSTYIRSEAGRPFNFLTSVIRNHLIGYVEEIHKRKKRIETNYFDNEEFVFNEKLNHLGETNYTEIVLEEEEPDSTIIYNRVIKLIEKDIKNNKFTSKKERMFAEQLVFVMKRVDEFGEFGWYNKFFIKLILQELTCLPRYTVNYYLSKMGRRYISAAYNF